MLLIPSAWVSAQISHSFRSTTPETHISFMQTFSSARESLGILARLPCKWMGKMRHCGTALYHVEGWSSVPNTLRGAHMLCLSGRRQSAQLIPMSNYADLNNVQWSLCTWGQRMRWIREDGYLESVELPICMMLISTTTLHTVPPRSLQKLSQTYSRLFFPTLPSKPVIWWQVSVCYICRYPISSNSRHPQILATEYKSKYSWIHLNYSQVLY